MNRLVRAGTVFAVVAVIVQTGVHIFAVLTDSSYLSANAENNPISWSHGVAIFASAFVCAVHAVTTDYRRRIFVALGVILSFLSLDEMVQIHERIARLVLSALQLSMPWDSVVWPTIYLPLVVALALMLASVVREAPRSAGRLVLLGLGFLVAAFAAEILSAPWSDGDNVIHSIEGAVEEAAELAGWITLATGMTTITLSAIMSFERP